MSDRLNIAQASAYLELSPATLARRRIDGTGPVYISLSPNGRKIRYSREALDKFLSEHTFTNRSQTKMPEREVPQAKWDAALRLLMLYNKTICSEAEQTGPNLSLRARLIWLAAMSEIGHPKYLPELAHVLHLFLDRDVLRVLCSNDIATGAKEALERAATLNRATIQFYVGANNPSWQAVFAKRCFD